MHSSSVRAPRIACGLALSILACRSRPSAGPEAPGSQHTVVLEGASCIRRLDGCLLCVARRAPGDLEEHLTRLCNPARPTDCVEFCTTLLAECATPWHQGPSCLAQGEDDFHRQQFWLEAGDLPAAELAGRVVDLDGKKL